MKSKTLYIALGWGSILACSAGANKENDTSGIKICERSDCLTPPTILREINIMGPKREVERLWESDSLWLIILKAISNGSAEWLDVADALRPGSDAGSSEELSFAIGDALEYNAEDILKRYGMNKNVCGAPDIDDPKYNTYAKAVRAINIRIQKIQAVTDIKLNESKDSCLGSLNESLPGLQRFFGVKK